MLYVGASLMIGASIYGFVDYKQTQGKTAFKEMYKEASHNPVVKAPVVEEKKEVISTVEVKTVTKETGGKKAVTREKEQPVVLDIQEGESIAPVPADVTDLTTEIETKPEVNVKKKKKLNHKIFSRAPLRDEIELEEAPKVKKEEISKDKS